MLIQEIIRKKRDRGTLSREEIEAYCRAVTDESAGEGQIAAFSMAVLLNGLDAGERVALTMGMAHSGVVIDWKPEKLDGPVLDKHSTGGVGDKVSLMLAPIVAACGAYIPMISGRGLGHTGGTLDKMDSIPGYASQPGLDKLKSVVRETGCAIVGATKDIAPADRRIYAVRDVTATVESLDLMTASILSKKLAAGLEGLVMDVKFGNGAFLPDYDDARRLAQTLAAVANGAGLSCRALMTDMNQVLGTTAGNAIEVREAVAFLRGETPDARLHEVVMALAAEMILLGRLAADMAAARSMAEKKLADGSAAALFSRMVAALGGPADIVERAEEYLPLAPVIREVHADREGTVLGMDTRRLGIAVIELGGGRRLATDKVDHSVGIGAIAPPGAKTGKGAAPLAVIHAKDGDSADRAARTIREAYRIGAETGARPSPVVAERLAGSASSS